MGLISSIRQDIISSSVPLAPALRKAHVLAYELDNPEFKNWVDWELNGYSHEGEDFDTFISRLPSYRKTDAEIACDTATRFYRVSNAPVVFPGLPEWARTFWVVDGIPMLEQLLNQDGNAIKELWPDYMVEFLNNHAVERGQIVSRAWKQVPKTFLTHIIETVRGRLLKFTLELNKKYPELDKFDGDLGSHISSQAVSHLVYNYITISEGGTMSTFDQRGQNVSGNQYNVAGDINFNSVQTLSEYVEELERLHAQLNEAGQMGSMGEEVRTDAEYHITKAIQQAKKPNPLKQNIFSHLTTVKGLLTGVASMAGFIVTLDKAIQVLDRIF